MPLFSSHTTIQRIRRGFTWLIAQDWDFDGDPDILVDDIFLQDVGLVLINDGQAAFSLATGSALMRETSIKRVATTSALR